MRTNRLNWLAMLLLAILAAAPAAAGERIVTPVGISIEMPDGWHNVSAADTVENLRSIQFDSAEFRAALARSPGPLITLMKYPMTHSDVIPTIKISFSRAPVVRGIARQIVLSQAIDAARVGLDDFQIVEALSETRFAGHPATHARFTFTLSRDGVVYPTVSDLWIVSRGDYLFLIGAGLSPEEPAVGVAELEAALASIRIETQR